MQSTPQAERLHIGIFGRRNSGKSSLINALTGQQTSLVSSVAGTTTDPVWKPMEIHGIGAVTLIDTAGLDDEGELGRQRVESTMRAAQRVDIAVIVCHDGDCRLEKQIADMFHQRGVAVLAVLAKADLLSNSQAAAMAIQDALGIVPIVVSTLTGSGIDDLRAALAEASGRGEQQRLIVGTLIESGQTVLLVMPQDIQAPRGRLILPQVQTIRELLDRGCTAVSCTAGHIEDALAALRVAPELIITDSQAFARVWAAKPAESRLTSFSILMAAYKGDIAEFVDGAAAIERLNEQSRVLIAEACTHAPLTEDIGRVKLPRMLCQKVGRQLTIDHVSGTDFPASLAGYDLVIHCGACMFNRRYLLSRISQAQSQGVPITNYGVAMAALASILDKVVYPTE